MELVLHIGAHRTGSTFVEQAISASIAGQKNSAVAIWPPKKLRDIDGFRSVASCFDDDLEPVNMAAANGLDALASTLNVLFEKERARGVQTLILSEENLIGTMHDNLSTGVFYGDVLRRLRSYELVLPMAPNRIALGVRDYGAAWGSAYRYVARTQRGAPPCDTAAAGILTSRRGWPEVVQAVSKVWPDAAIIMWQQENLHANATGVCAAISGMGHADIVAPKNRVNATLHTAAALFSNHQKNRLTRRYLRHLDQMRSTSIAWAA